MGYGSRARRARIATILALILLAGWAGAVPAHGQTADPAAADRRLREIEDQIRKSRAEHEEIKRKALAIAEETARVRSDLVSAARAAQESEELLSELESQLEDLKAQEAKRGDTLHRRSEQMTGVLTALQRLAWRPTEALIVQPQSPADTVRSAILLRSAVPQIEHSVADLKSEIDMMAKLRADVIEQSRRISTTTGQLEGEHRRLRDLWERKSGLQTAAMAESEAAERRTRQLAEEAEDLRDLLKRLEDDRKRRLQEEEEARKAKIAAEKAAKEAEVAAKKAAREAEIAAKKAARDAEIAAQKAEKERKERELADARTARETERRAQVEAREKEVAAQKAQREAEAATRAADDAKSGNKEKPFTMAQGRMLFPARGKVETQYGQANDLGLPSKGIIIATRRGAQVVAPYDGRVAFSGPFRGYGLLLIIEHGEGYHTLLAGMSQIDATVGQRLLAGEPVGVMSPQEEESNKPSLYVELRRNGQPVNPLPWLTAPKSKVNG